MICQVCGKGETTKEYVVLKFGFFPMFEKCCDVCLEWYIETESTILELRNRFKWQYSDKRISK